MVEHYEHYVQGIDRDLRPGDRLAFAVEVEAWATPRWAESGYGRGQFYACPAGTTALVLSAYRGHSGAQFARVVTETSPLRFTTVIASEVRWLEEIT